MAEIVEAIDNACFEEPYKLFLLVGAAGLLASLFLNLKAKDASKTQAVFGIIMTIGLIMKYGAKCGTVDLGLVNKAVGAILFVDGTVLTIIAALYGAGRPYGGWSDKHAAIFRNLFIVLGAAMIIGMAYLLFMS